jgi:hypothetical protein
LITPDFSRPLALLLVGATALAYPREVRADDAKVECIRAHEQAQTLRQSGHLGAARRALLTCVQSTCPGLVREDCGRWLGQLDVEQPSVVIAARDEAGKDTASVQVLVDGAALVTRLDGEPVDVDPGLHTFRFVLPSGRAVEREVLVRAGEKARELSVTFEPPPPPATSVPPAAAPTFGPPPPPATNIPPAAAPTFGPMRTAAPPARSLPPERSAPGNIVVGVIAGIVGAAALGSAIYFTVKQANEADALHEECPRGCPTSAALRNQVNEAMTSRVQEGVSFAVAGLATGVALYFLLARPFRTREVALMMPGRVDLEPSSQGASVRWSVAF